MSPRQQELTAHLTRQWGEPACSVAWLRAPGAGSLPAVRVLVFPPSKQRSLWTYATVGFSADDDDSAETSLELFLLSPVQDVGLVELLTAASFYHSNDAKLDLNHTVSFGRPWLSNSSCDYGLLSLPYLDGPALEWYRPNHRAPTRYLWLIPITRSERDFKARFGVEELERRFEAKGFEYASPARASVV